MIAAGQARQMKMVNSKPFLVKVGDSILFGSYAGTEVKHDEEEYLILSEDDILGILY